MQTRSNDADRQLAHWLAVRGCGIRTQIKQVDNRPPSKRSAKAQGAGIKHARKKEFKWLLMPGGKRPAFRNQFGIP